MKEFHCGDLVPGCDEHFLYDSYEELLYQVVAHARHDHGARAVFDAVVDQLRGITGRPA